MIEKKKYVLSEIAEHTHCQLIGNPDHVIFGVADLETAQAHHASFLSNSRYQSVLAQSQAGVIFVDAEAPIIEGKNYLVSTQPSQAFQRLLEAFHPPRQHPSGFKGIHPTAVIHETAEIGKEVSIGPYAVIDEYAKIGDNTFIGTGAYIGPHVVIGQFCLIHARVVIREECYLGDRVIIQPGAIIGSCGFGYVTDKQGKHTKLHQVGNVILEDDVEIGANTTIDRARFQHTQIGRGTKVDNLVQLAHGVHTGKHNIIVAQTGIAGSTTLGDYVVLGGQVAVAGHLRLETGVMIAGKSGVTKSLSAGKYGGIPAIPLEEYNRNQVMLRNIKKLMDQVKELFKRIEKN